MLFRSLFALASPAGARARLSVLIFHRVLPAPDPLFPGELDARRFDEVCGWLRAWFNVLPLDAAVQRLREHNMPARALAITFDDGYADNHDVALPILLRHGLPATFFIATGFLDGGRMWNDTVIEAVRRTRLAVLDVDGLGLGGTQTLAVATAAEKRAAIDALIAQAKYCAVDGRDRLVAEVARRAQAALPDDLMLRSSQVQQLRRAGMQIGAHTVSHPILARLNVDAARQEIAASKTFLEGLLGERVGLFAYPNGKPGADYTDAAVAAVRGLGFDAAVSTAWGAARASSDLFQLARFTPWDRRRHRFGARLLGNLMR
jgi:peptidoglycan/xylan/chitin deacetylase (PgdA/CDA1 family)